MNPESVLLTAEPGSTRQEDHDLDTPGIEISDTAAMESDRQILDSLEAKLDDCQLRTEQGKSFIPRGTLERILDQDTVRRALQDSLLSLGHDDCARYATLICGPEPCFRKIFTILILSDMIDSIVSFVDLDLDDSFLPMPDPKTLESFESDRAETDDVGRQRKWNSVLKRKRSRRRMFFMSQWSVMSPIFESIDQVKHFSFSHNDILPFLEKEHGIPTDCNSESDSVKFGQARYGGYSEVRRVQIHPDHYNFGDYRVDNPDHLFALKRLHTNDSRELWREVDLLKRFRNDHHIIQLLATFEVHENAHGGFLTIYYLIFPWAMGDLESLWEAKQNSAGDYRIAPWISQQCYLLAKALSAIHQDADDHNSTDAHHLYGRHGDIKPANILWFPPSPTDAAGDFGLLVLGDFGLADFRTSRSRSNVDSLSLARSPKYRPPEFDIETGKISRKIDIWMLGCTFLEFITWFLMGFDVIQDQFREARSEPDIYGVYADTFFRIVQEDGRSVGMVKPQVTQWIARLYKHNNCSNWVHAFLGLIENHMLAAEPKNRLPAFELSQRLKQMYSRCQDDTSYYRAEHPWIDKTAPEEARSCHSGSESDEGTKSHCRRKSKGIEMVRNALRHAKASSRSRGGQ